MSNVLLISQVHAGWSRQDGYVAIPEGSCLHLFSEPGNVMINTQADWGAVASAESLRDIPAIVELFKQQAERAVDEARQKLDYWLQNAGPGEPGYDEVTTKYTETLNRSVKSLKGSAKLELVGGDIIYDYKISSLALNDAVFDKDKPGDVAVKRLRSALLGRVSDSDIMLGTEEEKHLSDYLKEYKGWDIFWFACQYGAAVKPDEEMNDMLQVGMVKTEANKFTARPAPKCDFMDDSQLVKLLGNSRPKTMTEIENSKYWQGVFESWITLQGSDVQQAYDAYVKDPKGKARDVLKGSGSNGDLRQDFYDAVGKVKDAIRG